MTEQLLDMNASVVIPDGQNVFFDPLWQPACINKHLLMDSCSFWSKIKFSKLY